MTDSEPPRPGDLSPREWARRAKSIEAEFDDYPDERIDILRDAAEAWYQAGELSEVERCHRQAAEQEAKPGGAHVSYTVFLFEQGDTARGYELLESLRRELPTNPSMYESLAEALEGVGDYHAALNWLNRGISRCYPELPSPPDALELSRDLFLLHLCHARRKVRAALEQPADSLDEAASAGAELRGWTHDSPAGESCGDPFEDDDAELPLSPLVLYWPGEEIEELARRHLALCPEADSEEPRAEHRRAVERGAREAAQGETPLVLWGNVADFTEFCRANELDPKWATALEEYTLRQAVRGEGSSWPPGRNDPCWCSSGRKYKKCCGAPGFVETARTTT
ncbi:SEC-C metal-binding domain-containing protein [Actinopolyspora mzabensis]|uniref:SEC-C metal-binding domain-containing protein n=1 Tax=Actinopolyspora mzabensis TaxID=995066 RepID=UPI000B83F00A|nr:SEC-C metal-binding domain-containing protein [Actinopolyspora mzabensis]